MIRLFCHIWSCMFYRSWFLSSIYKWNRFLTFAQCFQRLPFDWKTPLGYCIAFSIQDLQAYATIINSFPPLTILIGSRWLLIGMCEDIKSDISFLNSNAKSRNAVEHFRNIIIAEFLTVKQLSVRFLCNSFECVFIIFQMLFQSFLFRFVKKFNANHQIMLTNTYWWARLTIWSGIAILIIQLVE